MKLYQNNTKISITIQGDGSEIFDYSLPQPHNYYRNGNKYTIVYSLNGYFHTTKGIAYLNDILARFALSMNVLRTKVSKSYENGIELSSFQGLKSIAKFKYRETVEINKDNVFWAIKLYTEHLIKEYEGFVPYSLIESFAFAHFVDRTKDKSTLKAKCRSIWNWYDAREWTIPERYERTLEQYLEETKMSRTEHMTKLNAKRAEENYKKVVNIITGLFHDQYKKKSGSWHIQKIADELNLTAKTVSKYIREYQDEK